ncbi:DUF1499 domain-containing protein [Microbulbifer thermotolerans]|uniref:DUF1499 domain-containing protein n=1 Tax=Microbulbifer thermotolerans TaxID=252514 RepID=UPI0022498D5C|nr:DUF1499 domain-containing protein [Microbulbifer thermotolerans]MCX2794632.1 DUF1499 domain-containing protein [Microbulbifer thermotolerans]
MREKKHWSRWLLVVQCLLLAAMFIAGLLLRLDVIDFRPAFQVFKFSGLAALGVALISMPVFIWGLVSRRADSRRNAIWAVVLGVLPVAVPLLTVGKDNFDVPRIHDISTDTQDPPRYEVVLSLREEGDNSPLYGGETVAAKQRGAEIYADIQPLLLDMPVARATEIAAQVAKSMGWRLVAFEPQRGHLEAVDRTLLLGFTDDVVVRVRPENGRARVDVRSSSRVGISDLGANAKRIRRFLGELGQRAAAKD